MAKSERPDPGTGSTTTDGPDPRRWRALAVCLIGSFMVLLDVSIVTVALHSITVGLDASAESVQWVLSGYALAFGLLLVPGGRLGDIRGRRGMFVLALVLFVAASVLCGAAPTDTWLVIARLLQGLAGGLLTPQVSGLIQQLFQGAERGRAFGMFGAVVGIATALGPLVGGLLIGAFGEEHGWRYVFFVNIPIGLIAVPFALRLLPGRSSTSRPTGRRRYDPVGVVLLGAGVVLLLLPFVQEQEWQGAGKWLLVPAALVVLTGFVLWERRQARVGHEPMLDLTLFRHRSYTVGIALIAAYFGGFTTLFFVLTLLLQAGAGFSALGAGLVTVPFAIGSGISAALAGRVVSRIGRPLVLIGLVLVLVGFLGVALVVDVVEGPALGWVLAVPLLIGGVGSGLVISPNQTLTLADVPVQQGGTAGGLLQTGQRIGSAIGIAAVGSVFYARLAENPQSPDFPAALTAGMAVAAGFLVLAIVVGTVDVAGGRRERLRRDQAKITA
ncbi:DHA2 family efflux MFS transporter permease subunit [Nakamurella sp. YIM 132087]|uniref:DHA2 family efflux MFS transporter permease subunit n=1 Tax=Nakamurella alba TaxID=2665158 RepID=A0A7K1FID0_9ACTN|nr:MFS transporter [Nakamurella alba]MTD13840.1 DHA2 family efflux MFS transporter permease subunit [Nakamurella alba]